MSYSVLLRRNSDGLTVRYNDEFEFNEFLWTEGNWSCDCNRETDFYRAIGEPPPIRSDNNCLGSGQFTVLEILTDDGRIIFPDDSDEENCLSATALPDLNDMKIGETRTIEFRAHDWEKLNTGLYRCRACGEYRK